MLRVLVCGSREFDDYGLLEDILNNTWRADGEFIIIHGCAKGADSLADKYATQYDNPVEKYPADWTKYGRKAGPIRNEQMLQEGKPDLVIAFPRGESRGTRHMMRIAREAGVTVEEY